MNLLWLLVIVLIIVAVAGLPTWPYSQTWGHGYWPSGLGFVLIILLIVLLLTGRL
jgi:hypothetical protein